MIVYRVINKLDGRSYIGMTIRTLKKRKVQHLIDARNKKDNYHFHRAIRKYGEESFEWKTIKKCKSIEELNQFEKVFITIYDTFCNGYNMTEGGDGTLGFKHTEEAKKAIGDFWKGRKKSKETIERMRQARLGMEFTSEHKKNLSVSRKDQEFSEATREKLRENSAKRRHDVKDSDIIKLKDKGFNPGKIAKELKCSRWTIRTRLKKLIDIKN